MEEKIKVNDKGAITKAAGDYMEAPMGDDRVIRIIASKEVVDRDGDIIRIAGIDTSEYVKNPVVLWMHDQKEMPVGKCIGLEKTVIDGIPALIADIEFAETEDGMEAAYLYKNGFLNAVSICFIPTANEPRRDANNQMVGWDISSCKLLEISAVNIPANQEALLIKSIRKMRELETALEVVKAEQTNAKLEIEAKLAAIAGTVEKAGSLAAGEAPKGWASILALADKIEKKEK